MRGRDGAALTLGVHSQHAPAAGCAAACVCAMPRPRSSDLSLPLLSEAFSLRSISQTRFRTQQASFLTSQSQVRPRVDRGACESTPEAGDCKRELLRRAAPAHSDGILG
eukprot:COSAG01_NODE_541_length_15735_cov_4.534088_6_plen_109_part_00